jgi:hypothetical protein
MDSEIGTNPTANTASGAIRAFHEAIRTDAEGVQVIAAGKTALRTIMGA